MEDCAKSELFNYLMAGLYPLSGEYIKNAKPVCSNTKTDINLPPEKHQDICNNILSVSNGETDINLAPQKHQDICNDILSKIHEKYSDSFLIGYRYNNEPKNKYFKLRIQIHDLRSKEVGLDNVITDYNKDEETICKIYSLIYDFMANNLIIQFREF
jgi:hypothetical protein